MNRVKQLRNSLNLSQIELADILNVHQTAVSQWETGRTEPDKEIAAKLAQLCGVPMEYVLCINTDDSSAFLQPGDSEQPIISNRIKELRKDRNITGAELGEIIGVAESTISQYETGKREPNHEILFKIADFFNVSIDYLLGRDISESSALASDSDNSLCDSVCARKIKELRVSLSLTQSDLACELSVSRSTIAKWESGSSQPSHAILIKLAQLFNVSIDYLLELSYHSNPPAISNENLPGALFPTKLKELRRSKGLSQYTFAADFGVSQSAVGAWESGARTPNIDTMSMIAKYFDVSIAYLLEKEERFFPTPPNSVGVRIPVCAIEDIIDYEEIPENMARNGQYIALRIKGDSMEPRMRTGDIVIVRLQPDVDNGDIAIVRVNGDEATCKKIKKTPEGLWLISTNPNYDPMYYSPKEVQELPVAIIGKVVELRAKF